MRTGRIILAASLLTTLIAGGYVWRRVDSGASARTAWISGPIPSDDDTEGISLAAAGFLDRDVQVTIYRFGEEDRTAEDFWIEEQSHGDFAEEFYKLGFRRALATGSKISRAFEPYSTRTRRLNVSHITAIRSSLVYCPAMGSGFNIFRTLETGERLRISWRSDLAAAEQLVRDLSEDFPAEYGIEEASGQPVSVLYSPAVSLWLN